MRGLGGSHRPAVADAARAALIPLRPLTIGEILDGGFLIVRRNVSAMIGLPLVVAGGAAAYTLLGVGLWLGLGNTTAEWLQTVVVVLYGLLGLFVLVQCLVWMTAILSRLSLQTVLGDGFAPSVSRVTLRTSWRIFWPLLGLSMLMYVAIGLIQTGLAMLSYLVIIPVALLGGGETSIAVLTLVLSVVTFLLGAMAYALIAMSVPALALESRDAPGWIGKPRTATTVLTAFVRSFTLIGRANLIRSTLVIAGAATIALLLITLAAFGAVAVVALFASSINRDAASVLGSPWTIFGVLAFAVLIAMSALLAYVAAVQTLLYLDLRMRRECLDLALRFDCVPVPQPVAPPAVHAGWAGMPTAPPPGSPLGPPPPGSPPPGSPAQISVTHGGAGVQR